jgi:hypothetical protein
MAVSWDVKKAGRSAATSESSLVAKTVPQMVDTKAVHWADHSVNWTAVLMADSTAA